MKKTNENERGIFFCALKAQIAWVISSVALLLIFCAVAFATSDPNSIIKPLSLTALYISAAVGGICAARLSGGSLLSGFISGIITALAVFLLSLIPIYKSGMNTGNALILNAFIIPAAAIGAFVGKPRAKNSKKRRAKIKKTRR